MSVSKCVDVYAYYYYLLLIAEHQILNLNVKFKMNLQDILDLEKR